MIAALFLRALDTRGDIYLPFGFDGDKWTDAEKEIVTAAIKPHVPERVDAGFNNFVFFKFSDAHFYARRFTWEHLGMASQSAAELADKIKDYYANP